MMSWIWDGRVAAASVLAAICVAATASVALFIPTAAASAPAAATGCRLPAGQWLLAHHNHVLVWTNPSVPGGSWGRIYACSPSQTAAVAVVTVYNPICPSPTGCTDWDQWNYIRATIAGSWVAASGAFTGSGDWIGLWNSRAPRAPRQVAVLPGGAAGIDTYALALRPDGALAFAYQDIDNFRYFDALDACGGGCRNLRRLDTVLYPASSIGQRQLLTDVHFGASKHLFWRDDGRLRKTRLS